MPTKRKGLTVCQRRTTGGSSKSSTDEQTEGDRTNQSVKAHLNKKRNDIMFILQQMPQFMALREE